MRTDHRYLKFVLLLAFVGFVVAGWLLSTHIKFSSGQALLTESCLLNVASHEGCANIAVSGYSYLFGVVPLAAIALGYYFAMLVIIFWVMRNFQASYEPLYIAFNMATGAVLVSVVMFYISKFKVHSFCIGCATLWAVNLGIWPLLVKHLGLNWGNALAANLETFRHRKLQLKRERIVRWGSIASMLVLVFALIGSFAANMEAQATMYGGKDQAVNTFRDAQIVFLPPEAVGGPTSKAGKNYVMDIVEFADFQCPACRLAAQYLRPFLLKHGDKVRFTDHNFPLDGACNPYTPNGPHDFACIAARAGICVAEQGKFFEFHDQVFDRQNELSEAMVREVVQSTGVDLAKFDECLKNPATEKHLQKEISWGDMIGLQSTPTFVINGKRLSGAFAPKQMEELLDYIEANPHH